MITGRIILNNPLSSVREETWYQNDQTLYSLVVQMVKNLPAMPESWVQLGLKDPLEKGMTIHYNILAWKIA